MEINKKVLIQELDKKLDKQQGTSVENVVETLFTLIKNHVQHGDTISVQEFSIYSKDSRHHGGESYSHQSGRRKKRSSHNHESRHYSSNFMVNELGLLLHDGRYLLKKTVFFSRNVLVVAAVVMIYYLLIVLIGC